MTKQEAIKLFIHKSCTSPLGTFANVLDISSSAVSQWPFELRAHHIERMYFAAKRCDFPQRTINKLEKLLKTMRS